MDALITAFTAYGLSGVVIGALFVTLYMLIKELKVMNDTHDTRVDKVQLEHKEERGYWLQSYKDISESLNKLSSKRCGAIKPND